MLQELLPPSARPVHRSPSSRVHAANRHPNFRLRPLPGSQRRHVSNGRPYLPRASPVSNQSQASTSASFSDKRIQTFNYLLKATSKDFDLSDAYDALRVICGDQHSLRRLKKRELIWFLEKFCNKIESFYGDENQGPHSDAWKVRFQAVLGWLEDFFSGEQTPKKQREAYRRLVARAEALDTRVHYNVLSFNRLVKASPTDFSLDHALKVFSFFSDKPEWCQARLNLLSVLHKFCDKVEGYYGEEGSAFELKVWAGHFQEILGRLEAAFTGEQISEVQRDTFRLLMARSRALLDESEAAFEILSSVRKARSTYHPTIVKLYSTICLSIFHHQDAVHVMTFLDSHFIYEFFRPPYCKPFSPPDAPDSIQSRHPRLLHILSTIRDPISLFTRNLQDRSLDWYQIGGLLIVAYCTHKYPQLALQVHDAMVRSQLLVHHKLKLSIVRALAIGRYFDDAAALLSTASTNTQGYTSAAIHLFAMQGDTQKTLEYYEKRNKGQHRHNRAMLLFSYAYRGMVGQVRGLFDEMYEKDEVGKYKGKKPTIQDYNVAIYAWARRGSPTGISYWLDRMMADGIKPGLHIYSSIIQSYIPKGDLTAIADVLDHINNIGMMPNTVIYTDIISALTRHYSPTMAETLFKRALREGVEPDIIMVGSLLNSYVEAGHWDEAIALFKSIESDSKSHLHLTIELYNMVLKAYVVMGAPFRVVASLFEKLDNNPRVSPTPTTFALLVQSACDSGYMQAALEIFKEMEKRAKEGAKNLLNAYVFTILMAGFLRKGNKERAIAIHDEMLNHGIKPTSATFNTVLYYYANRRSDQDLLIAHQFMARVATRTGANDDDEIPIEDINSKAPTVQLVYEPVLRGYAAVGKVDAFERLLEEMLDVGGQVTVPVLSALMNLYRQKGRLDSAHKVWDRLVELGQEILNGIKLDDTEAVATTDILCYPLTIYLDMLCQAGEHDLVLNTWQRHRQMGFRLNFFNWNRLGTYLISAGRYEAAFEIMEMVVLPYIRATHRVAEEISSSRSASEGASPTTQEGEEEKQQQQQEEEEEGKKKNNPPDFRHPFEILNRVELPFLQIPVVSPTRPFTSYGRSLRIQDRHLHDQDDYRASSRALYQRPLESDTIETAPPPVPDFITPLTKLLRLPGYAPRPHYTLMQHLLIGYQRLRAGQPAIPTVDLGGLGDVDYYAAFSEDDKERIAEQFRRIKERFPNAVDEVLAFEEKEKERMGLDFQNAYIWS